MKQTFLFAAIIITAIAMSTMSCKKENALFQPAQIPANSAKADTPYLPVSSERSDTPYLPVAPSYADTPYLKN